MEPGVSRVADRRGGPSTGAGIEYQVLVASYQTLVLLDAARRSPGSGLSARFEPRELVEDGQVGFDFGWEGGPDAES